MFLISWSAAGLILALAKSGPGWVFPLFLLFAAAFGGSGEQCLLVCALSVKARADCFVSSFRIRPPQTCPRNQHA